MSEEIKSDIKKIKSVSNNIQPRETTTLISDIIEAAITLRPKKTLALLKENPQCNLPKDTMLPLLIATISNDDVETFGGLLNTGMQCQRVSPAEKSLTEHAYLSAFYKGESLFRIAFRQEKVDFLECLLRHCYFQGIIILKNFDEPEAYSAENPTEFASQLIDRAKAFVPLPQQTIISIEQDIYAIYHEAYEASLSTWNNIFNPSLAKKNRNICDLIFAFHSLQHHSDNLHRAVIENGPPLDGQPYNLARTELCLRTDRQWNEHLEIIKRLCPQAPLLSFNARNLQVPFSTSKDMIKYTPFDNAIRQGQLNLVILFHKMGVSLDRCPTSPFSPLYLAVANTRLEIVKFLAENNVFYDVKALKIARKHAEKFPTNTEKSEILEIMEKLHRPLYARLEWRVFTDAMCQPADVDLLKTQKDRLFPEGTNDEEITESPLALLRPGIRTKGSGIGSDALLEIARLLGCHPPKLSDLSQKKDQKTLVSATSAVATLGGTSNPITMATALSHSTFSSLSQNPTTHFKHLEQKLLPAARSLSSKESAEKCLKRLRMYSTIDISKCHRDLSKLYILAKEENASEAHSLILENREIIAEAFNLAKSQGYYLIEEFPFPKQILAPSPISSVQI